MAESPPRGGAANAGGDDSQSPAKAKGESDPLFNPPALRTRKTVMGLAPPPHLAAASAAAAAEAEARKQRVLGRRTSTMPLGTTRPDLTGPPPPPEPVPPPHTGPPPPKHLSNTVVMAPQPKRTISSDPSLPTSSGWDVHAGEEVVGEVIEPAPTTARMLQSAAPVDPRGPAPVQRYAPALEARPATLHRESSAPPALVQPTTALALRPYEPPHVRNALSGPFDPRLALLADPHSTRAASFRLLRDNLLAKSLPRVVAVSSALPRDGKTTCASNLALALAEQSSTRVLLVDGNFFEPELAQIFGIDRLTSIVPGDAASWLFPYRLVEVTPVLHVASIVRSGGELPRFEQHRFEAMIDRLCRVAYDYIVIDAPALRGTPAVVQILTIADGTILAVRAGATSASDLRRAAEQIPPNKALGIALIDAPPQP